VRSITSVLRQDFYLSIASNSPATVLLHHKPIALVPLSLALMTACGGGDLVLPENGSAVAIRVVDGDGQQGAVGAPLGAPVVVEVTSAGGDPVPGAMVEFALTSAGDGGEIAPATALTSADGRAQAHVLLGDKVGLQTGEARVPGGTRPSTTFSALAVAGDNQEPGVSFGWACEELACQFTDASTDRDGTVTGWAWDFGDGSGSADPEPSHTYSASGTYTVTLTVTDDGGSTGTSSKQVAVPLRLRPRATTRRTRISRSPAKTCGAPSPTGAGTTTEASRADCGISATGAPRPSVTRRTPTPQAGAMTWS
jgi:chitodextrinase